MRKFILSLCLLLGLSSTWLHSQSVNLNSFQAIQLMSLEECAVVQVNASWNYANRLDIATASGAAITVTVSYTHLTLPTKA